MTIARLFYMRAMRRARTRKLKTPVVISIGYFGATAVAQSFSQQTEASFHTPILLSRLHAVPIRRWRRALSTRLYRLFRVALMPFNGKPYISARDCETNWQS